MKSSDYYMHSTLSRWLDQNELVTNVQMVPVRKRILCRVLTIQIYVYDYVHVYVYDYVYVHLYVYDFVYVYNCAYVYDFCIRI